MIVSETKKKGGRHELLEGPRKRRTLAIPPGNAASGFSEDLGSDLGPGEEVGSTPVVQSFSVSHSRGESRDGSLPARHKGKNKLGWHGEKRRKETRRGMSEGGTGLKDGEKGLGPTESAF